jgi:hypothetical protein
MPIDSFLRPGPGAFDADVVAAMTKAFDAACNQIQDTDELDVKRDVIAGRIIAAARHGERDPARLLATALRRTSRES